MKAITQMNAHMNETFRRARFLSKPRETKENYICFNIKTLRYRTPGSSICRCSTKVLEAGLLCGGLQLGLLLSGLWYWKGI